MKKIELDPEELRAYEKIAAFILILAFIISRL